MSAQWSKPSPILPSKTTLRIFSSVRYTYPKTENIWAPCLPWSPSAYKKSETFCTLQKRHIFCKNKFSQKISLRSSKKPAEQTLFDGYLSNSRGTLSPQSPLRLCGVCFKHGIKENCPVIDGAICKLISKRMEHEIYRGHHRNHRKRHRRMLR